MCGIAGLISYNEKIDPNLILSMTDSLYHRGPDAGNIFANDDQTCLLGHRRLSIIDLHEKANQPMISSCGNYIIVYNGEVYNYKEIRKKLEQEFQFKFKTNSDTEVILEAFIKWGNDFVQVLNGMFAIAIYNKIKNDLTLFRDRLGKKPIYFINHDGFFGFASELKALKKLKPIYKNFTLNRYAINQYLQLGYIQEPHTIFAEVNKMKAGSMLFISNNQVQENTYWSISEKIKPETLKNEAIAKKSLNDLIKSSIEYRLNSDVPYGVLLSGGIDSSVVAAYSQESIENKLNSFSIGFKEAKYNESIYAKEISKFLGTDHHEFEVSYKDAIDIVEDLCDIYDEPYADSSAIPTLLVSKLAKKHVSMVLTGDGGDEQFLGYGMYKWANRLSNPIVKKFRNPISSLLNNSWTNSLKRVAPHFSFNNNTHIASQIFSIEQGLFLKEETKRVLSAGYIQELFFEARKVRRKLSSSETQALFDIDNYLNGDLLVKVDRATMFHSLEARCPLLDYRILEFSINLDETLKVKNGQSKYLLKSILYDKIPQNYFNRPKWGFSIPLQSWLKNEMYFLIEKYFTTSLFEKYGILNSIESNNILKKYLAGENYLYNKVWLILCLNIWLEKNQNYFKEELK